MWLQRTIRLTARPRGFHLVTAEVLDALPELREISVGTLQQGIYLCEHRDHGGSRSLVATAWGESGSGQA